MISLPRLPNINLLVFMLFGLTLIIFFLDRHELIRAQKPKTGESISQLPTKKTQKWIVVTSIQYPTEDVKRLTTNADFTIVVVGDKKTPSDWHLADVHYLSPDIQESLGFETAKALPWKSYTRKNIGYLYAMANGARWIYDTDDDNKPWGKGLSQFDYEEITHGLRYTGIENTTDMKDILFNPYRHFGNENMWPRGFPLEHIKGHVHRDGSYRLCRKMRTPAIQQGIVNQDPDVDAIYRLLHAKPENGLNERFNQFAPPVVLAPGTYAPFNSQNTLFSYSAFFTMFLPTTVSFRVCDIWRGYFAQILLHLAGETVSFVPPNAKQVRNAHSYLQDFDQEIDVYKQSGAIIEFAQGYECEHATMEECTRSLASEFAQRGFWQQEDVQLIDAWISDLKNIGYKFPPLRPNARLEYPLTPDKLMLKNCRRAHIDLQVDLPSSFDEPAVERAANIITNYNDLREWCTEVNSTQAEDWEFPAPEEAAKSIHRNGTLAANYQFVAIITNNYQFGIAMGMIQRMYSESFGAFIYCGAYPVQNETYDGMSPNDKFFPNLHKPINYVYLSNEEVKWGYHMFYCMVKIAELRLQNVKGYFMFSDDMTFNFWHPFDYSKAHTGVRASGGGPWWYNGQVGQIAANRTIDLIKTKYSTDKEVIWMLDEYRTMLVEKNITWENKPVRDPLEHLNLMDGWIVSDWVFMPGQYMEFTRIIGELYFEGGLFHELFYSKILYLLPHEMHSTDMVDGFRLLWGEDRHQWSKQYRPYLVGVHPIKPSMFVNETMRREFCDVHIRTFHTQLFGSEEQKRNFTGYDKLQSI